MLQKIQEPIVSLFSLPDKSVFVGRSGSSILYIHGNEPPLPLTICERCQNGKVMFIRYLQKDQIFVCGFSNGAVHTSHTSQRDMKKTDSLIGSSCGESKCIENATAYQIIYREEQNFEVWCGSKDSFIDVSIFNVSNVKDRKVQSLSLKHRVYTVPSSVVSWMCLTSDKTIMFVVLEDSMRPGICCLCRVGVVDKEVSGYWTFNIESEL